MSDELIQLLGLIRTRTTLYGVAEMRGEWGVAFPAWPGAYFHVVDGGEGWLHVSGDRPRPIADGEVVLLAHGTPHRLTCAPDGRVQTVFDPISWTPNRVVPAGAADDAGPGATMVCGVVEIAGPSAAPLIGSLPMALTVGGAGSGDAPGSGNVALTLRLIDAEAGHRPAGRSTGSPALLARLGDVLFMQILRAWLQGSGSPQPSGEGWFAAMRDPQIGTALVALHAEPAVPWTVSSLAGRAGLSRSRFAERFTALVGESPLAYLTRWRLDTAAQLLGSSDRTVRDVARAVGYGSESAFSRAFTRHHGVPPSQFPAR